MFSRETMRLLFLFIGICSRGLGFEAQERGQCSGMENVLDRNFLFNTSMAVDPCADSKIQVCFPPPSPQANPTETCTVQDDPSRCPFKLLISDYDKWTKTIKVGLLLPVTAEFFIEVRGIKNERLGFFEDIVFRKCNSYACCDIADPSLTNVARRCPEASKDAPTALAFNKDFYSIFYLWHVPQDIKMDVTFLASFVPSPGKHWESVKSDLVQIDTLKEPNLSNPPAVPSYFPPPKPFGTIPRNEFKFIAAQPDFDSDETGRSTSSRAEELSRAFVTTPFTLAAMDVTTTMRVMTNTLDSPIPSTPSPSTVSDKEAVIHSTSTTSISTTLSPFNLSASNIANSSSTTSNPKMLTTVVPFNLHASDIANSSSATSNSKMTTTLSPFNLSVSNIAGSSSTPSNSKMTTTLSPFNVSASSIANSSSTTSNPKMSTTLSPFNLHASDIANSSSTNSNSKMSTTLSPFNLHASDIANSSSTTSTLKMTTTLSPFNLHALDIANSSSTTSNPKMSTTLSPFNLSASSIGNSSSTSSNPKMWTTLSPFNLQPSKMESSRSTTWISTLSPFKKIHENAVETSKKDQIGLQTSTTPEPASVAMASLLNAIKNNPRSTSKPDTLKSTTQTSVPVFNGFPKTPLINTLKTTSPGTVNQPTTTVLDNAESIPLLTSSPSTFKSTKSTTPSPVITTPNHTMINSKSGSTPSANLITFQMTTKSARNIGFLGSPVPPSTLNKTIGEGTTIRSQLRGRNMVRRKGSLDDNTRSNYSTTTLQPIKASFSSKPRSSRHRKKRPSHRHRSRLSDSISSWFKDYWFGP